MSSKQTETFELNERSLRVLDNLTAIIEQCLLQNLETSFDAKISNPFVVVKLSCPPMTFAPVVLFSERRCQTGKETDDLLFHAGLAFQFFPQFSGDVLLGVGDEYLVLGWSVNSRSRQDLLQFSLASLFSSLQFSFQVI